HEDHLGSIRFVSSSTGTKVFSGNYVPYGPQNGASGTPDEFMFAGKIYDGSTGFYYFGGRFYDPATGRFITQDSSPGVREDPQSFDRYVYARDNPLEIVDPNGHDWWSGLVNTVTSFASSVTNAWNSLPPPAKDVIIIGAAVAVTVATGGAAAPALLAGAAIMGGVGVGVTAVSEYASTGSVSTGSLLDSFATNFATYGLVAGLSEVVPEEGAAPEQPLGPREIGEMGDSAVLTHLASQGIDV